MFIACGKTGGWKSFCDVIMDTDKYGIIMTRTNYSQKTKYETESARGIQQKGLKDFTSGVF